MAGDDNERYATLDPILFAWAQRHSFLIETEDRGYVVRSIRVPGLQNRDPLGQMAQLWVDFPDITGQVPVNVAIGRWSSKQRARLDELEQALDTQLALLKAKAL
jgi:hypothetical protein